MNGLDIIGIAIISGIGGAVLVSTTNAYFQRRNLQFNTFATIFKMLSDKDHWTARRNVLKSYKKLIEKENPDLSVFDEEDMRIVRSDFDQIGVLIYKEITEDKIGKRNLDKNFLRMSKGFIPMNFVF